MNKICYITLHTTPNYGSCLQAYATQSLFESLGWEPVLVDYWRKTHQTSYLVERAFKIGRLKRWSFLGEHMPHFIKSLMAAMLELKGRRRRRPFKRFQEEKLHKTRKYISEEELELDPPVADAYCTGSDQVWNSIWNEGFEDPYYLTWAPIGKPRIAFAASIGRDKLDEWEKPLMREALGRYDAISMREKSGVQLLESLGIEDAFLVLDPTLMLNKVEWEKIATIPSSMPEKYILVYQLNPDERFGDYTSNLSQYLGIPIVKICYERNEIQKGAINLVTPEVSDFVGLFLKASYIVTDSFHATAFSLNFEKPFVAILPSRFSTRIANIVELTGTTDRIFRGYGDVDLMLQPIDFSFVKERLNAKRKESLDFLSRALGEPCGIKRK